MNIETEHDMISTSFWAKLALLPLHV